MTVRIEHRIGVATPAEVLWDVLADFPRWREWNAVHPEFNGKLLIGGPVEYVEQLPGKEPQRLAATVDDWTPMDKIHLKVARGLMNRSFRYLEIDAVAEQGCIFSNGEIYSGLVGEMAVQSTRGDRFRAFRDLGETLKARAEQLWAERRGEDQPALL